MELCRQLPHSEYLSAQDLDRACEHRKMWLHDRHFHHKDQSDQFSHQNHQQAPQIHNSSAQSFFLNTATDSQKAYLKNLEFISHIKTTSKASNPFSNCSEPLSYDHKRVRRKTTKNPTGKKAIRKEFRMLTAEERLNLTLAMNILKTKMIDNISIWDLHTVIHYPDSAPGAHWGPAFLPWHREFLRQFEAALQKEVPGVAMPYWDSTLDSGLPEPSDSVMWMDELMGNGNGYVKTGPFKDWNTNVLMPLSPVPVKKLYRSTGGRTQDRLLSPRDVEWITNRQNYSELTFCHDKTFESMHGLSHVWVGGFMFVIRVSPNDPTFYMHHAFVDYMWEQFRMKQQTRKQREKDYARKICNKDHGYNAPMTPFNLKNKDGMSNDYTDYWYEYQPVRHCTEEQPNCDSAFYFCDPSAWKCRSRIQLGGNCTGFMGTEICYKSVCIQNTCRLPATEGNGFERKERRPAGGIVWAKTLLLTEENRPLSSGIAHVVVRDESMGNEETTAFMQRTTQYPEIPGVVYLPLPHPSDSLEFNITLEARDHYGRYCQSYCLNGTTEKYQVCEPKLMLKTRNDLITPPSNISFTHSYTARRFLDMDMSVHPSLWSVLTPYMVFACHKKFVHTSTVMEIASLIVTVLKRANSSVDLDELQIEAEDLEDKSDLWMSSLRRARSAYDQSIVFVRARNPRVVHSSVKVQLALRHDGLRMPCEVRCTIGSVVDDTCESSVILDESSEKSQEQIFVSDPAYLQLLDMQNSEVKEEVEEDEGVALPMLLILLQYIYIAVLCFFSVIITFVSLRMLRKLKLSQNFDASPSLIVYLLALQTSCFFLGAHSIVMIVTWRPEGYPGTSHIFWTGLLSGSLIPAAPISVFYLTLDRLLIISLPGFYARKHTKTWKGHWMTLKAYKINVSQYVGAFRSITYSTNAFCCVLTHTTVLRQIFSSRTILMKPALTTSWRCTNMTITHPISKSRNTSQY
uniref:Tyrosinase copper-binding domain-containing protein n=1 Tax=Ditylenchus dipsaci TaxID=166011 RepID=A0A915EFF9_9BILA